MDRILVTGVTGFIGSAFVRLFGKDFSEVVGLSRRKSDVVSGTTLFATDLGDYNTLADSFKNINCVVHTAYDTSDVTKNLAGLKNIIKACVDNKVRRLVYLSSFAVYDPKTEGSLNEDSRYSTFSDPYSRVKIQSERILREAFLSLKLEVIILQPTVVYGLLGNWSAHAVKSLASGALYLPYGGNCPCNAVHVNDVAAAINLTIRCDSSLFSEFKGTVPKFLISANAPTTWRKFYESHRILTGTAFEINKLESPYKFGNGLAANAMYKLLFSRAGFLFISLAMPALSKLIGKRTRRPTIQSLREEGKNIPSFVPVGMNRVYHSQKFEVDITLAKKMLHYNPKRTIDEFPAEINDSGAVSD